MALTRNEMVRNAAVLSDSIDKHVKSDGTISQTIYDSYMQAVRVMSKANMIGPIHRYGIEAKLNTLNK